MKKAIVVFSGGQDSTTCLGVALTEYDHIHCIGFDYGQQHAVELECAQTIVDKYDNVDYIRIPVPAFDMFADSALLKSVDQSVNEEHSHKAGLPASFVPNRNAVFLTLAHAYAQKTGAEAIFTGVCETDYSGYPDCRSHFIRQLETALNSGAETEIPIITPLMFIDKAGTFKLAENVGILDDVVELSHTCYNGDRTERHDWGYGCGNCPACELRAKGWELYKERF